MGRKGKMNILMTEAEQYQYLIKMARSICREGKAGEKLLDEFKEAGMDQYKVDIPEGVSGNWRVEKYEVTQEGASFHNLRCAINPHRGHREILPGTYTRLMRGSTLVMSDTPAEIRDHLRAIHKARGHVLINGLGLGMVAEACLKKDEVTKVTVIELSQDVIDLVAPTLMARWGDRVEIIQASAYEYKPPKGIKYGAVWHDIWDYICSDNIEGMKKLHRKYGHRTEWQGSWCRSQCEMHRRRRTGF